MMSKRNLVAIIGSVVLVLTALIQPVAAEDRELGNKFVKRDESELRLNGKPFRFGGANNYYLMYKSQAMVDDVLTTAAANNFNVIRMWGSLEIGNQDGSNSINGKSDGVYFQYWNGSAPAYNDGEDGLKRLDYAIYKAGQLNLKLVIPFVNNWNAFGGIDQYVRWRGGQYHDEFYTDPLIRQWYKNWIAHLLNRTNSYTGVQYKNDPTIMTWELANEPRCKSAGAYPASPTCTTQTLTTWADEMSTYIKSIDKNHLVSVGDEGFYCIPGATDWTENCGEGVDTIAFTRLKNIDVMSLHLYPDSWGKDAAWGTQWIARHIRDAKANRKAVMLGEFGLLDKNIRNPVYKQWTDTVLRNGGNGALFWILSGKQDDGTLYPDYDGFTVYCPSPVCTMLSNFGQMMAGRRDYFPPVADNDSAITNFNTPVTLDPAANDIAYGRAMIVRGSLDLDPATAGQQTNRTIAGQGTFTLQSDNTVTFTPVSGFAGKVTASYTIQDSRGQTSNVANLIVTVKPDPTAAIKLFSFEDGTQGWAPGNWQGNVGTVAQSTRFATDGSASLQVDATSGAWFGLDFSSSVNLTGKTRLKFDLKTGAAGTSQSVALKLGDSYTWCQAPWSNINANTTTTVDIDLTNLGCSAPDLSKVQSIYVWFSAGTFYLDNVRAE